MTPDDFRRMALGFPEAAEGSHFESVDFRVRNKIFACFRPAEGRGALKLSPGDQQMLCEAAPATFAPIPNAWGAKGRTHVRPEEAEPGSVRHAMAMAWRSVAPKRLAAAAAPEK